MLLEPQRVALTLESQLDGPDFQRRIDRRVEAVVGRTRQHYSVTLLRKSCLMDATFGLAVNLCKTVFAEPS